MSPDAERKRELLQVWLAQRAIFQLPFHAGGSPDAAMILADLRTRLPRIQESVYILVQRSAPTIPLYIGRATNPLSRWQSHLKGHRNGLPRYARWTAFFEQPLDLFVVPVCEMYGPPIPFFPVTAGAVESQLISLGQDAYPGLLNREGVGR
ncbi:hypothetical protein GCM10022631_27440 [Deinococcus rubellus]|uniref:GIY-YIG nuclease family protein n=1 Tax=Deinococcus rubellus TaxID=1889240 RepID=UPI0031E99C7F